jgi:formylglycine-generating enzyme required for sulfatase activity
MRIPVLMCGCMTIFLLASAPPAVAQGDSTLAPGDRGIEEMVLVPGGEFVMGVEKGEDNPAHSVYVSPFYMDTCEVTCAQYQAFCEATGRKLPEFWGIERYRCGPDFPDHPVLGVSQADAMAYAAWVGKRLPTEAEWEFAARGGLEGQAFPYGDEMDKNMENFGSDGTVSVGSYPPNGYGLHDMAGNLREWVLDYYDWDYYREGRYENPEGPCENPKGPAKGKFCVVRGGGWHAGKGCSTVFVRYGMYPTWVDINVGFRCVKSME